MKWMGWWLKDRRLNKRADRISFKIGFGKKKGKENAMKDKIVNL